MHAAAGIIITWNKVGPSSQSVEGMLSTFVGLWGFVVLVKA